MQQKLRDGLRLVANQTSQFTACDAQQDLVTVRSLKRDTSNPDEAEVAAAAMSFVCCEGLACLLNEWGIGLDPPTLLVDNKSWGDKVGDIHANAVVHDSNGDDTINVCLALFLPEQARQVFVQSGNTSFFVKII